MDETRYCTSLNHVAPLDWASAGKELAKGHQGFVRSRLWWKSCPARSRMGSTCERHLRRTSEARDSG